MGWKPKKNKLKSTVRPETKMMTSAKRCAEFIRISWVDGKNGVCRHCLETVITLPDGSIMCDHAGNCVTRDSDYILGELL
jgi:hypothetical protein